MSELLSIPDLNLMKKSDLFIIFFIIINSILWLFFLFLFIVNIIESIELCLSLSGLMFETFLGLIFYFKSKEEIMYKNELNRNLIKSLIIQIIYEKGEVTHTDLKEVHNYALNLADEMVESGILCNGETINKKSRLKTYYLHK